MTASAVRPRGDEGACPTGDRLVKIPQRAGEASAFIDRMIALARGPPAEDPRNGGLSAAETICSLALTII